MSSLNQQSDGTEHIQMCDHYSDAQLSLILRHYLDPEGNLSLRDAVALVYRMLPEMDVESMVSNMDHGLFENNLLQIAAKIPYNDRAQFRLAKLVGYLINSHKLSEWHAEEKGYTIHKPWENIRTTLNNKHPWTFKQYGVAGAQVNMNAFIARLTCLGALFPVKSPWAIWTLRDALEENQEGQWDEEQVSSAAMWIICAGQWVFNQIGLYAEPQPIGWHAAMWQPGPLYEGPIAGLERWYFWQARFVEAANSDAINYECKEHASKASQLMKYLALNAM